MKIELEIDDSLYRECRRKNIDIPTFCTAVLWCYVNNIIYNGNGSKKVSYLELKSRFRSWLLKRVSKGTADKYIRLLNNISTFDEKTIKRNYERVRDKRNFAKAVRKFAEFLQETGYLSKDDVEAIKKLVPIPKTSADNNIPTDEDIREAFCYFSAMKANLYLAARILLYSGARGQHVVEMINNFDSKKLTVIDGFAKYNINIDRGTKKAYYIYFPAEFVDEVKASSISNSAIRCDLNYKTSAMKTVSAKYLRKWFNNLLVRMKVDKDVRNFILGRSGEIHKSVEAEHYLELAALADEVYPKIMSEIRRRIRV